MPVAAGNTSVLLRPTGKYGIKYGNAQKRGELAMDAAKRMIIAKGKNITARVSSCEYNRRTGKWDVIFTNGSVYSYRPEHLLVLTEPRSIEPGSVAVSYRGKALWGMESVSVFSHEGQEYWHIRFTGGRELSCSGGELEVESSVLSQEKAAKVFDYLRAVADAVSIRTEDGTPILTKQYDRIGLIGERSAASFYLDPDSYVPGGGADASVPIFPFGCNESQYRAVTNALRDRLSVIQGPPGTGKTQTILNILANLVLQGRSVQVVSSNNSAVENVLEKLASPRYGLDFLAARLGREENREAFLSAQSGTYPDFSAWLCPECEKPEFTEEIRTLSGELLRLFKMKNELARLRAELEELSLERRHYALSPADTAEKPVLGRKPLSSAQLSELRQEYEDIQNGGRRAGLFYRLLRRFTHGVRMSELLRADSAAVLSAFRTQFYAVRTDELTGQIRSMERELEASSADTLAEQLTELSLKRFRHALAVRYGGGERRVFGRDELWREPQAFLKEYPIVLSTTYMARGSLGRNGKFDYVIMDEASQVDVATGLLALSSASCAVVVGDTKQLPNVVTGSDAVRLREVFARSGIRPAYDYAAHSFLSSLCELLGGQLAQVTLREHYRCAPEIIDFCNRRFYNGELIVMTPPGEGNALKLVTTVPGNHEREHMNQRQIDVIRTEVLPELHCPDSEIGVIAPYNRQVERLRSELGRPEIDVATVHKFQGREKDVMILSTVDDRVTPFSDDGNLLNVAVSRAKKQLIVVASDAPQPPGSNVGDLIGYIRYRGCEVQHSAVSSVFDFLYADYRESRMAYLKKHGRVSEYDSENLMYALIREVLAERGELPLEVACHPELQLLFRDQTRMSEEERRFVNTGLSHLDFLIFNRVTKEPVLAIEVDGFRYHREGTRQAERDRMKDHILSEYGLPLLRFPTNGSGERERLRAGLSELFP